MSTASQFKSDGRPTIEGHEGSVHFVFPNGGKLYHTFSISADTDASHIVFCAPKLIQIPNVTYTLGGSATLASGRGGTGLHMFFNDSTNALQHFRYVNGAWAADMPSLSLQSAVCPSVCCGPGGMYMAFLTVDNHLMLTFSINGGSTFAQPIQLAPPTGTSIASIAPSLCCTQNGIAVAYVSSTNKILINQYSKLTANLSVVTSYTAVAGTGISLARADYSSNFLVLAWQDAAGPSTSFVDQSVTPGSWSWSAPARNPQGTGAIDNGPELAFIGVHLLAAWRWVDDHTVTANISDDKGATWLAQARIKQPSARDVLIRNRGIATAGTFVVVLDDQGQAWRTNISSSPNTWSSYPSITGGIDMIAVGDMSNNNTDWRLFSLSQTDSTKYYWRSLSDLAASWTQGNNGFVDTPRTMISFSFGGLDPKFIFGVLTDGNYNVTLFPNGNWWKNWHANMGPNKPTQLTQLVTCNLKNYGLDSYGSVFSQTLWQASGPVVSQWHQCLAPGNRSVALLAASKTFVFAFATDSTLWKMDSTSATETWTNIPQINPATSLTPVTLAASDSTVILGSADGSISSFNVGTATLSQLTSLTNNAVIWKSASKKRESWWEDLLTFLAGGSPTTMAYDLVGDYTTASQVSGPPPPPVVGTKKATLVRCGVDNSQGINIVSKMIKKYFEYQDADIVVLDDRDPARTQPTVANVTTAFENLLKETRAGDVRLFYFDGHGGTIKDVNGDEPDKKDETLGCSDGELVDDDLADAISEFCHPKCNLTMLVTTCHGGTLFDNQFNKLPGQPGPKRGISLSPVRDNQVNKANNGGDYWTYAFRDVMNLVTPPNPLTYQALFNAMKSKYYTYPNVAPSSDPTHPDPNKQDPLMSVDPDYMNVNTQLFLASLS